MAKKVLSVRVIILIVALISAVLAINPNPWASGIEVGSVRGVAAENGLKIGSIVNSVNGKAANTVDEFNKLGRTFLLYGNEN